MPLKLVIVLFIYGKCQIVMGTTEKMIIIHWFTNIYTIQKEKKNYISSI